MIRNAVIHLANEQPLLADLPVAPTASDISLICTNLRTFNGKRPVFADDAASLFVFPYAHIRFLEVPPAALAAAGVEPGRESETAGGGAVDVLAALATATAARNGSEAGGSPAGAAAASTEATEDGGPGAPETDDLETELEIDEDFLRRVREI